jgi:hypothetical protein
MLESARRTVVKLVAGWIVAYLAAWGLKYGLEVNESFNDVVFNTPVGHCDRRHVRGSTQILAYQN